MDVMIAGFEDLTKGEAKKAPDLDIEIKGGSAEIEANAQKTQKRRDIHLLIAKDPALAGLINPQWRATELLRLAEYEDQDVKAALSPEMINLEILSNASQAIQEIMKGKEPKTYRTATLAFVEKIKNFALDNEMERSVFDKMILYAAKHIPIAQENSERMTRRLIAKKGAEPEAPAQKPQVQISEGVKTEEPIPGTPGGTLKTSQEASNLLQGKGLPATAV